MNRIGVIAWLVALYAIPILISLFSICMAIFNSPYGVNYIVIINSVICLAIYTLAVVIVSTQKKMSGTFGLIFAGIQFIVTIGLIGWALNVLAREASSIWEDGNSIAPLLAGLVVFSFLALTYISLQLCLAVLVVVKSRKNLECRG